MELKISRPRRVIYEFTFDPLPWLDGADRATLETLLLSQRGSAGTFWPHARAKRCRDRWALCMPLGSFHGSFGPEVTQAMEDEAREALLERIRIAEPGSVGTLIHHEGLVYCPLQALSVLRRYARLSQLFSAAYAFVEAAWTKPTLIRGTRTRQGVFAPLAERPLVNDGSGRRVRIGPWLPEEDAVLRTWFSRWPDGKHHVLTDEHWSILLDKQLKGMRSKASVLGRLNVLNSKLRWRLTEEGNFKGKMGVKALEAYLKDMLGQRIKLPAGMGRIRDIVKKPKQSSSPFDE